MSKFAIAHAMKKKRMAKGGEVQGVHKSDMEIDAPEDKKEKKWAGESSAGRHLSEQDLYGSDSVKKAKGQHHRVLGEMKSMPKPNLEGLAEGGEVKSAEMGKESPMSKGDMYDDLVDRIMMHKQYSEGGEVQDDTGAGQDVNAEAIRNAGQGQDPDAEKNRNSGQGQDPKYYSRGGKVSNRTPVAADFEPNQFDDLVLDDDMDFSYTGDNSGDEIGNEQEDEDRHDIVSRMMKSSRKKDRNPRPA